MRNLFENRLLRFIILGVIFFVLFSFYSENFSTISDDVKESQCVETREIRTKEVVGVVVDKYRDYRQLRYIRIQSGASIDESELFVNEHSDFYDTILVGDTIKKDTGTLTLQIIRNGKTLVNDLYYGCDK